MPNSHLSGLEVIGVANAELTRAAKLYSLSRRLQIATFAFSVTSVLISNPYTYIPALLALAAQAASWLYRYRAAQCHALGEEGRTRGLLQDALGSTGEKIELTNWLGRISNQASESAQKNPVSSDYFASQAPAGMQRLRDHLQENAFWGKCLYGAAAKYYLKWLIASATTVLAFVLMAIPLASDSQSYILARIVVAVLASGVVFTQASEIYSWRSAESKIDALDRRLDVLVQYSDSELRSGQIQILLAVYGDYCVASMAALPVPHRIYKDNCVHLNDLWQHRRSGQTSQPTP